MRINKFVARSTNLSRRDSDELIKQGKVKINNETAQLNSRVNSDDTVLLNGKEIAPKKLQYVVLYKPFGFLCSRRSQGNKPTVYDLLPEDLKHLQVSGRLDHDTSGLVLLTNDGDYANRLTHPRYEKDKKYKAKVKPKINQKDIEKLNQGIELNDGLSKMNLIIENDVIDITMSEGKNRQIRRSFEHLGYDVIMLHRYQFGPYTLDNLESGKYKLVERKEI